MDHLLPDGNYTVLPLSKSVVRDFPEQVRTILNKESTMRRPIVISPSINSVRRLCASVVPVQIGGLSDDFDSREVAGMTSEDAFEMMIGLVNKSNLPDLLSKGKIPLLKRVPNLHGHTFGFDNLDAWSGIVAAALTRIGALSDNIRIKVFGELPGVFSADPFIVEPGYCSADIVNFQHVRRHQRMSFLEAQELSTLKGPKAFTSGGLMGLDQRGIQLQIRPIQDLSDKGTRVSERIDEDQLGVRFVSGKKNQILYTVSSARMGHSSGIAKLVLEACDELNISVTATFGGGSSFPFTIDGSHPNRERLESRLEHIGNVNFQSRLALVSCIGTGMKRMRGLSARITTVLDRAGVNGEEITTSADRNFTFVVRNSDYETAIVALHRELIEGEEVGR